MLPLSFSRIFGAVAIMECRYPGFLQEAPRERGPAGNVFSKILWESVWPNERKPRPELCAWRFSTFLAKRE